MKLLSIIFLLSSFTAFCQKYPKTGHEVELFTGYSFYAPSYQPTASLEWIDFRPGSHLARYGVGYTFRKKKLRHHLYIGSYSTKYDYERSTGDFYGWTESTASVKQQWLEIGGYGGLKVMDSLNLYPCIGFSFGLPIVSKSSGTYQSGSGANENENVTFNDLKAPTRSFDLRLGAMYNWELSETMGVNTALFYSRSLVHPDLLLLEESIGKIKVNQFMFNLSLYFFIPS
jgi:hypothetical protein